jgi:hypothetical protein
VRKVLERLGLRRPSAEEQPAEPVPEPRPNASPEERDYLEERQKKLLDEEEENRDRGESDPRRYDR